MTNKQTLLKIVFGTCIHVKEDKAMIIIIILLFIIILSQPSIGVGFKVD